MSQPALRRYWLNRDISHLWEMNRGPLTPVDRTEEVYLAADIEQVLKDAKRFMVHLSGCGFVLIGYGDDASGEVVPECTCGLERLLASLTEGS